MAGVDDGNAWVGNDIAGVDLEMDNDIAGVYPLLAMDLHHNPNIIQ